MDPPGGLAVLHWSYTSRTAVEYSAQARKSRLEEPSAYAPGCAA
jgi:hypothetical protein